MKDQTRQSQIDHATQRGGKPLIALTPNNWALILRLLDRELRDKNGSLLDDRMYRVAVGDIIDRIEDQL